MLLQSPAEAGVIRTYIETMLEMPWNKRAEDFTDIAYAKELLEAEHYGLPYKKWMKFVELLCDLSE